MNLSIALDNDRNKASNSGLEITLWTNKREKDYSGIQIACLGNEIKKSRGLQIGTFNYAEESYGVQIGGLSAVEKDVLGLQANVFGSLAERVRGVQVSLVNLAGESYGFQIGAFNMNFGPLVYGSHSQVKGSNYGVQIGISNINEADSLGIECGVWNINENAYRGVQIGVFSNEASETKGAQLGIYNKSTEKLRGLQIGLVNNCGKDSEGVQIGLINYREGKELKWYEKVIPIFAIRRNKIDKPKEKTSEISWGRD